MNAFIRLYGWSMTMKFHMAIYTLSLVALDGVTLWLMGERAIPILTLLEMTVVSMAVAMLESWIFPREGAWEGMSLVRRTALWALMCNLGFIGGALVFGWFQNVPGWAAILLVLFLEFGITAMWFGVHVVLKKDTQHLNQNLKDYQNGTKV